MNTDHKRLLVLSAAYPAPSEPERAVFIENITRELVAAAAHGFDVTVIAPRVARADPRRERRRGLDVRRFSYPSGGRRLKEMERPGFFVLGWYLVSACLAALAASRPRRPDLILAHWVLPMGAVGAVVARVLRRPFVVIAHGSDVRLYGARGLGRWLSRWALRRARRVAAVSHDLEEELSNNLDVPMEKLMHLPMGVDAELFHLAEEEQSPEGAKRSVSVRLEARSRLCLEPGARVLLFVGDLTAAKGVAELVSAWRRLRRRFDALLCLVGDGPLGPSLRAQLEDDLRRGSCVLPGRVPQEELVFWYRASDLLVLPSHSEGAPVVVMEALACGLPVVATRVGGNGELVEDGVTGRLVAPGEADGLASTLEELLADDARLESCRAELRRRPQNRSCRTQGRRLAEVLREACDGGATG